MLLEQAVRYSEIILALAYAQQSIEFIRGLQPERTWGVIRLVLSLLLLMGFQPVLVEAGLLIVACVLLYRFQGPYNGGSDCMSILVLLCLFLSHIAPSPFWQQLALGYLAFQLTFSYFQSGYIKIINADWRSGQALADVFAITAYPVSEHARRWAKSPQLMFVMSWSVIVFELLFPLSLLNRYALIVALAIAAMFHLANACLFGLNRFFWIWPAAYPIILWFQSRLMAS
ncbi:MAG TPA: HTTM domain-containing protein [Cellvibrio sp.]|nr:HTTM domain-containing protein [Cellvibrio sp.]